MNTIDMNLYELIKNPTSFNDLKVDDILLINNKKILIRAIDLDKELFSYSNIINNTCNEKVFEADVELLSNTKESYRISEDLIDDSDTKIANSEAELLEDFKDNMINSIKDSEEKTSEEVLQFNEKDAMKITSYSIETIKSLKKDLKAFDQENIKHTKKIKSLEKELNSYSETVKVLTDYAKNSGQSVKNVKEIIQDLKDQNDKITEDVTNAFINLELANKQKIHYAEEEGVAKLRLEKATAMNNELIGKYKQLHNEKEALALKLSELEEGVTDAPNVNNNQEFRSRLTNDNVLKGGIAAAVIGFIFIIVSIVFASNTNSKYKTELAKHTLNYENKISELETNNKFDSDQHIMLQTLLESKEKEVENLTNSLITMKKDNRMFDVSAANLSTDDNVLVADLTIRNNYFSNFNDSITVKCYRIKEDGTFVIEENLTKSFNIKVGANGTIEKQKIELGSLVKIKTDPVLSCVAEATFLEEVLKTEE